MNVEDCEYVTLYENCDYTGDKLELVDGSSNCLEWDP